LFIFTEASYQNIDHFQKTTIVKKYFGEKKDFLRLKTRILRNEFVHLLEN
jgi:hypothetical protein